MKLTAEDLLKLEVIEKIIPEPESGIENDLKFTTDIMKNALIEKLKELCAKSTEELLQGRYDRFRKFGNYIE